MVGSVAISAGFATYLGIHHYGFRRKIIEQVWPDCLKERGIIVDINIGNSLTVDITMSVASEDSQHVLRELEKMEDGEKPEDSESVEEGSEKESVISPNDDETEDVTSEMAGETGVTSQNDGETEEAESKMITQVADEDNGDSQSDAELVAESVTSETSVAERMRKLKHVKKFMDRRGHKLYAYENYCLAVLLMLTGNELQQSLVTKGINYRELEDLAIVTASVQTPLLVIDPYNVAMKLLGFIKDDMVKIDMSQK